jgi:hypothetical protein
LCPKPKKRKRKRKAPFSEWTVHSEVAPKRDTQFVPPRLALAVALPASWARGVFFLLLMQETSVCFVSKKKTKKKRHPTKKKKQTKRDTLT